MTGASDAGLDLSIFDTVIAKGGIDIRCRLARNLAELIIDPATPDAERKAIVPTLLKLAVDSVADVRRTLAQKLTEATMLHADVVFTIVADDDDIALPFLALTPALDSWMMTAVARVGDLARQIQVALRSDVSREAASFIVTRSEFTVCMALLDNPAAPLDEDHFRALYHRFGQAPEIVERLLARDDLPLDIRIMQARRASNRIHQLMAERGWVPANDAAEIVADAEETAVLDILASAAPCELEQVIGFLTTRNMLTASIIMRAACLGEMEIVERALAHLCSMPLIRARQIIYDRGPGSLRALYKRAGLPPACFWLLRAAFDVEGEASGDHRPSDAEDFGRLLIEALMTRYESVTDVERAKHLDIVSRFAADPVRHIARRLKTNLVRAA